MSAFSPPGAGPARTRLVTFGLVLVIVGWVILVADLVLGDAVLKAGSLVVVLSLKSDIITLAEMAILTGLGLALLGGLREGFGALNRFFDAVLQRSTGSRTTMPETSPTLDDDDDIVTVAHGVERMVGERGMPPVPGRDRNYIILPDGSVEVDTLLGTRIFASMDEARDFIR